MIETSRLWISQQLWVVTTPNSSTQSTFWTRTFADLKMVIAMAAPTPPPSRPLRGSRLSSFYPTQPSEGPSLSSLDSAFQLQEYISLLIRRNPHDVDAIVSIPERSKLNASCEEKTDEGGEKDSKGEPAVDEACWIYEQLRYDSYFVNKS